MDWSGARAGFAWGVAGLFAVAGGLAMPPRACAAEAADMGFYESPWGKHQKVQLLTVSDLLDGARVDMPPATGVNVTYKKARKSALGGSEQLDLTEQGE